MFIKPSEHKIILRYLKDLREDGEGWVLEGTIRSKQTPGGWIGFRGDRNCRDLIKMGRLEKRMNGKFREVRYNLNYQEEPELTQDELLKISIS